MNLRILFFFIAMPWSSFFAQDTTQAALRNIGVGISVSSLSRIKLLDAQYPSIGGTGFEISARLRYWRLGLSGGYGLSFNQTPDKVNLKSNRMESWGGELELRLGPKHQWNGLLGIHGHYYNYVSETTEITPGIVVESLTNEITQEARYLGAGYQFNHHFRLSFYYQWERVDKQYTDRRPSSAYLLARLSLILDSNQWKATKEAKE